MSRKLERERDEPRGLSGPRPGSSHRRVLLEQGQQKGTLRGELPVDSALREARGLGDLVERGELDPTLSKDSQARLKEQGPSLCLPSLPDDTHKYL